LGLAAFIAGDASAQAAAPQPTPPQPTPQAAPPSERSEIKAPEGDPLAPLAWLEGCWRGTAGPREFHEHWLPLRGSVMVGASQTAVQNKTTVYEFLRLEARPDGVYYVVRPSGKDEFAFRLTEATLDRSEGRSDESFVFALPAHDFPQKITYRRASQGWLYATLDGKVDGQDRQIVYPLRRVGCESGEFIRR